MRNKSLKSLANIEVRLVIHQDWLVCILLRSFWIHNIL